MSVLEIPMGLLDRILGSPPRQLGVDDTMLLRLERGLRRVQPDPLFQRRLRGHVVNRYVAAREGLLREPRPKRQMGKLGRAVLCATLALTLGVSAAGAAAQDSIPGDLLYAVKLQLEEVRMRIAPAAARGELAEIALAERVDELQRLAAAGAWHLVPAATTRLTAARQELIGLKPSVRARAAYGQLGPAEVLEYDLAEAPPAARDGLERALQTVQPRGSSGGDPAGKPAHSPPRTDSAAQRPARGSSASGEPPGAAHDDNTRAAHADKPSSPPTEGQGNAHAQGRGRSQGNAQAQDEDPGNARAQDKAGGRAEARSPRT